MQMIQLPPSISWIKTTAEIGDRFERRLVILSAARQRILVVIGQRTLSQLALFLSKLAPVARNPRPIAEMH